MHVQLAVARSLKTPCIQWSHNYTEPKLAKILWPAAIIGAIIIYYVLTETGGTGQYRKDSDISQEESVIQKLSHCSSHVGASVYNESEPSKS